MTNPFKVGDKVVRKVEFRGAAHWRDGEVFTVIEAAPVGYNDLQISPHPKPSWKYGWDSCKFRAAIAGQDYDVPKFDTSNPQRTEPVYAGHHSDGSSIQNHSCGGRYPYVLVYRDKKQGWRFDGGKYDVGVIGPNNQDPIWCKSFDHAVTLITTLKDTKA